MKQEIYEKICNGLEETCIKLALQLKDESIGIKFVQLSKKFAGLRLIKINKRLGILK